MLESAVVGAVLHAAGKILLGLRASDRPWFPDCWDIVGGHVEPGETADEALVRELREELGITPTAFRPIAERNVEKHGRMIGMTIYRIDAWTGIPRLLGDEHAEFRWFTRDELRTLAPLASEEYRTLFDLLAT